MYIIIKVNRCIKLQKHNKHNNNNRYYKSVAILAQGRDRLTTVTGEQSHRFSSSASLCFVCSLPAPRQQPSRDGSLGQLAVHEVWQGGVRLQVDLDRQATVLQVPFGFEARAVQPHGSKGRVGPADPGATKRSARLRVDTGAQQQQEAP